MFITSGKLYDRIKWVAQIGLPAFGVLYVSLASIWELPNVSSVSGTILAVDTFLGVLLGLSASNYKASDAAHDGSIDLVDHDGSPVYSISLKGDDPDALLASKDRVTLKVNTPATSIPMQPGATSAGSNGN